MDLVTLNQIDEHAFTETLGEIFEHSPWIPRESWSDRPFSSIEELHQVLCKIVATAPQFKQLELICAHPDLAGKLAIAGELTDFSRAEQKSARLDALTPGQFEKFPF